jgi:hypothetical protein
MAERSSVHPARRGLLAAALAVLLPSAAFAQAVRPWPPGWKWTVSAAAGFYPGTAGTWEAIDAGRHVAGSVTIPATPVTGAAGPLPALSVPLSVTVVSVGVGWRF